MQDIDLSKWLGESSGFYFEYIRSKPDLMSFIHLNTLREGNLSTELALKNIYIKGKSPEQK